MNSIHNLIYVYLPDDAGPFELLARLAVAADERAADEMIAGAESQLLLERAAAVCALDARRNE